MLADLAMDFGCFAVIFDEVVVHVAQYRQVAELLGCSTLEIVVLPGILDNLACWISPIAKEMGKWDSRRRRLVFILGLGVGFALLLSMIPSLLFLAFSD
jgi:hypothetical protein